MDQAVVVAVDVEQTHWLVLDTDLIPRGGFGQFVERADAAGQRDERVGAVVHERFALVHPVGLDQLGVATMGDLFAEQVPWDNTDDFAATFEDGVREKAHEADRSAAVDERDVSVHKLVRKCDSRICVSGVRAGR